MVEYRQQAIFDFTPDRAIIDADLALIEERRDYLRAEHKEQARASAPILTSAGSLRSIGGALWSREMGFAKVALLNRGALLLDHWAAIKRERDMPLRILAWEVADVIFARATVAWGSAFGKYVLTSEQDASTRTLNGGRWIFEENDDLPGFSTIPDQEAMFFYGEVGGEFQEFLHPQITPHTRDFTMTGGTTAITRFYVVGGEPPIVWSISGPDWITIADNGIVSLAPPELPAGSTGSIIYAAVNARGVQDVEAHASLTINLLPIRN